MPLDTLGQVRARLGELAPALATPGTVTRAAWGPFGRGGELDRALFAAVVPDFYLTNPISRASTVMRECASCS